jgi:hypothetical protein
MKATSYLLIFLIVAGIFSSCKKLDQLVSFNLDTSDSVQWIGIPDTVLTDTFNNNETFTLVSETYNFSDYAKFATNKTTPSEVEDVQALNFIIELNDDSLYSFGFCRDLTISLSSPTNAFQDIDIYTSEFPDPTGDVFTAELLGTDDEFLKAIQKDKFRFKTVFTLLTQVPDTITFNYKMGFRLKANPVE